MSKRVCILSSVHRALDNRVFYREARSLVKAGYEVTLIAVHDKEEVKDGVRIVPLPAMARWQRPKVWLRLCRQALKVQADVFHFHDPELLFVTPWLRLVTGKPTIYDVHEVYADFIAVKDYLPKGVRRPAAWAFRWLEPLLARLQSGLVFSDEEIAKSFARVKRPKATLFNFPGRFLLEQAAEATKAIEVGERRPVILHLGGHERNRGTRLMVAAFELVYREMPEARLVLVGHFMPPALEQEVREDLAERGLMESVTILGRVPFETIGEYLRQAAVGWVPWQPYPKNEKNVPTKLFEYMAYGLPIVSSSLASTRPFVHDGENGYLVTATEAAAHARTILHLLRHPHTAWVMGRKGQALVQERYNWDRMEGRLWGLYEEVLGQ